MNADTRRHTLTCPILLHNPRTASPTLHTLQSTVTLQENAQSAMMTQYDVNGVPTVYNCALGVDAQCVSPPSLLLLRMRARTHM